MAPKASRRAPAVSEKGKDNIMKNVVHAARSELVEESCSKTDSLCDEHLEESFHRSAENDQSDGDSLSQGSQSLSPPPEAAPEASHLQRTPSASNHASSDMHSDRRLMGAAATIGGTTGMLLMGPATGVALSAAALYATTREDAAGTAARKASSVYLQVADRAVDEGIQYMDRGLKSAGYAIDEGRKKLAQHVDTRQVPAPLRETVRTLLEPASPKANIGSAQKVACLAEEVRRMREKYPDRVPVMCERSSYSDLPEIDKKKFVVPGAMLCGEFKYIVHKHITQAMGGSLSVEQTIYIFVNGKTPKTSTPMSELYEQFRAEDGYLHVRYGAENTLG
eukprot:TRINITY_DN10321_c0_g1_i2.p1 TRINITY_DN10321_c0_g1~~TRINITY_DN10321_c0_g1_i2.p1  ORF type:complete len:371 (-),score=73.48 TRINITY_DN10321_c0_g1_i2:184-1191(-)